MTADSIFDWNRLGDMSVGRANIGPEMPVSVFRLMQYALMDELKIKYGQEGAHAIFNSAGQRAGQAFTKKFLDTTLTFNNFLAQLQQTVRDLKIGIMRVEASNIDTLEFTLCIEEDIDCSGLPVSGETVCWYDEGFIAGILKQYTNKDFLVVEVDCWASGGRACRFEARPVN